MSRVPERAPRTRFRGGWAFLLVVLGVYVAVALFDRAAVERALADFGGVAARLGPTLLLIFALMFVIHLTLEGEGPRRFLGEGAGVRGWVLAVAAGVLSLGPVYPWYALLAELRTRGMRPALIAAFLYARAIKLPLLPVMWHYFGLTYVLVLSLWLLVFSVASGWLVGKLMDKGGWPDRK